MFGSCGYCTFNALRSSQNVFWLYHSTFPPTVYEDSSFSTSSPILVTFFVCFFNFSHLRGCEEVSHCGLELYFPKSSWHWTSFYLLVGYITSFEKWIFKTKWKWNMLSCARLFATLYSPWNSPGQNTGVGSLSLFQGIFPGIEPNSSTWQADSLPA